jgi:hypothetical protein
VIEIPIGKALRAEEAFLLDACNGCVLFRNDLCTPELACSAEHRSDGKDVIFKLVDLPTGWKDE